MTKKVAVVLSVILTVICIALSTFGGGYPLKATPAGATAALSLIKEWATWMSGIETAALTVLVYIMFEKDTTQVRKLAPPALFFAILAGILLAEALLGSSWVLASLPSQEIRISTGVEAAGPNTAYDVYEQALFEYCPLVSLGYLLRISHWLWGFGLLSLGLSMAALVNAGRRA